MVVTALLTSSQANTAALSPAVSTETWWFNAHLCLFPVLNQLSLLVTMVKGYFRSMWSCFTLGSHFIFTYDKCSLPTLHPSWHVTTWEAKASHFTKTKNSATQKESSLYPVIQMWGHLISLCHRLLPSLFFWSTSSHNWRNGCFRPVPLFSCSFLHTCCITTLLRTILQRISYQL